ncbi:MAG: hypothetical protein IH898_13545 [Planctomycetes bacterium]|nr:hypothetical protein [Planctomycetota bacterium]
MDSYHERHHSLPHHERESDVTPAILQRLAKAIGSLVAPAECQQLADYLQDHTDNAPKAQGP